MASTGPSRARRSTDVRIYRYREHILDAGSHRVTGQCAADILAVNMAGQATRLRRVDSPLSGTPTGRSCTGASGPRRKPPRPVVFGPPIRLVGGQRQKRVGRGVADPGGGAVRARPDHAVGVGKDEAGRGCHVAHHGSAGVDPRVAFADH
jgi:hypothetical protein